MVPQRLERNAVSLGFNGAAPMKERKTAIRITMTGARTKLQWGRSDEGAEDDPTGQSGGTLVSFNGAAPMKERKTRPAAVAAAGTGRASMGPLR